MPSSQNAGLLFKFFRVSKRLTLLPGCVFTNGATVTNTGTVTNNGAISNTGVVTNSGTLVTTGVLRIPVGVKPGTCTVGDLMADSADANKLYQCTTTNTWTKVGTQT